jgi:hypothetical protein
MHTYVVTGVLCVIGSLLLHLYKFIVKDFLLQDFWPKPSFMAHAPVYLLLEPRFCFCSATNLLQVNILTALLTLFLLLPVVHVLNQITWICFLYICCWNLGLIFSAANLQVNLVTALLTSFLYLWLVLFESNNQNLVIVNLLQEPRFNFYSATIYKLTYWLLF